MIKDFTIEYRTNPIGIDVNPRFSWKLEGKGKNVTQKKYQIQVIKSGKMIWDSGLIESDQSVLVPYSGGRLEPMSVYHVQVSVWDNHGEMGQKTGKFEMGLMSNDNWKADWITHTIPVEETMCPVFVKDFDIEKKVREARLYVTCCGVYEAVINEKRVGDVFMAPGWTSYHNRIQYQTYDITEMLEEHNNVSIMVGNGWYKGYLGFDERPDHYGDRTALLAMMHIVYTDGSTEDIGSDIDWIVETGEVTSSEIYYGETQDYTSKKSEHGNAILFQNTDVIGSVTAQESEPITITERIKVKDKIITPKGELVFDFGQNLTGIVEIKLPKLSGSKLVIKHAETLDKDGNFYTENLRTAISTDCYVYDETSIGKCVMPHFTFHGFRYICVEGVGEEIDAGHFTACVLHTNMQQTGSFVCDNKLVNQLQSNIIWGQRGNFLDIPTDCPQRNERLGWTGDAQVFCGTASYNYNTALFFQKWMRDMNVETTPEWGVPHVVPNILGDQEGAAGWSDAATIIPWKTYQIYGDKEILAEQFPLMKSWVTFIRSRVSRNGLWQTGFQYGDWLALDIEAGSTDRTGGTDKYLVANAYYAYSTKIVRDAAHELGLEAEEREYGRLYEEIVNAINKEFVTESGRMVSETQTACTLMLYFDLVKPEHMERVLTTLEQNIGAHRNHLTTGFLGTPYLCHCLSENRLHDLAAEIFMKDDFPSWFYAVKKGATTIWERWNSILPNGDFDESGMNSLNHYAYGSIGSWLYEKVAGINCLEPGYKKIKIQPFLTKGITEVEATYESAYGTIKSAWSCKDGKICADILIPANTTAEICLPEKEETVFVGSGEYHYEYETSTNLETQKYSTESTLGDLVAEELGVKLFNEIAPGMLDNPMIKFAYDMTIADLIQMAAESKPLYQAVIDALNENEREYYEN
ncbi:alpha-L-rhamnosidase [Lachnospiraceae bacterium PF1-21]|uniref:alpha-L-rhamnosidase n=1 Tax=Ohessyouella blattaphilus TaxID=2949333 RepID=UPI00256CADFD|nr:glycoside hydrolase family 78 protein [Lachnospiraceae bacterium OttesenSCG-928-J05]